ncbi:MAG: dihydroorotase [bacterium]
MKPLHVHKKNTLLIKGCRLLDPANGMDKQADIVVEKGTITRIAPNIEAENIERIDLSGNIITPGWFDMHVHFREPGREDEETVKSGCAAAAAGGFTGACPMPNTQPVADSRSIIEYMIEEAKDLPVDVYPIAAATKGSQGKELTEIAELIEAGAVALSDDGVAIATADIARRVMEYASMFDVPIIEHCEEPTMTNGGAMNEGAMSTRLGIPGMPGVAEDIIVARDILLTEFTGARLHIAHISTARSVDLVREAKKRGIQVTCEVMPHHFCLTDEAIASYDANFKMNPPLRTKDDVAAMIEGLKDGTIDVIATDHAPHSPEEKDVEFAAAPFGIIGLETALGLMMSKLVEPGHLPLAEVIKKVTYAPRHILHLPQASLKEGTFANLTIFHPGKEWVVGHKNFYSKSRNTPFGGWKLKGEATGVFNKGMLWLASYTP